MPCHANEATHETKAAVAHEEVKDTTMQLPQY
jgi:hypothetical protein